jgi:hypothetical protein
MGKTPARLKPFLFKKGHKPVKKSGTKAAPKSSGSPRKGQFVKGGGRAK